jgi:hypothetical protein
MILSLIVTNGVARVVFSTNMTISIVDRGGGVLIEFDKQGHVVAARFNSYQAALNLIGILISNYSVALSTQEKSQLLAVF